MNRLFSLCCFLLLSAAIVSCEGSFGPRANDPSMSSAIDSLSEDVWYHHADFLVVIGIIQPVYTFSSLTITPQMRVMIGWEAGSSNDPKLIFTDPSVPTPYFSSGTVSDTVATFIVTLGDSLLLSVLHNDTRGALAIGHLFLVTDPRIIQRSVISYSQLTNYSIEGASDQCIILYRSGTPSLHGVPLDDANSQSGYNILYSVSTDPVNNPYAINGFSTSAFPAMAIFADTSRADIKSRNPLWLY